MKIKQDYSNREITVYWDQSKCIHAGVCYTHLRRVFNPIQRPWVDMDGAPSERIIEVVKQCPSGALSFEHHEKDHAKRSVENEIAYIFG